MANNKVYPVAIGDPSESVLDMRTAGNPGAVALDGFVSLGGGMNAGTSPALLEQSAQYAFGVNVSSRGGLLHTRPPFIRFEAYIPSGKFQGACLYRTEDADRIVYCIDGVVWTLNLNTFRRYRIGAFPTTTFDRAYFCQADKYMIIQNGIIYPENWPIIIDRDFILNNADVQYMDDTLGWQYLGDYSASGTTYDAVRVPIGTTMTYGHGRLFVTVPRLWDTGKLSGSAQWLPSGGHAFCASDIYQSDNPPEFLAFIESTYLSGGGALQLPANLGYISGMTLFRAAASGTGLGALVVFGSDGVCAYGINSPRDQWQSIDLANVLFLGSGTESPNSIVAVNDDLAFRAADGTRFVKYAATQAVGSGGNMSNVPQSHEVNSVLELDSRIERPFVSAAYANNRLLMTAAGNVVSNGTSNEVLFDAVVSLDTANVSSVTQITGITPVYDGIWTGHKFLQILKARYDDFDRAFAFVRVGTRNELWYLSDSDDTSYLDGNVTPIEAKLVTRTHAFQTPRNTKEFKFVEEWLSKTRGTITLGAYWRSDSYELWNACVPYTFTSDVTTVAGSLAQSKWRLRLPPASVNTYDIVSGRDVRMGTTFQFCFTWSGSLQIEKVLLHSLVCSEPTADTGCEVAAAVPLLEGSGGEVLDMYDYVIPPLAALAADSYWEALALGRVPLFYWVYSYTEDGYEYGDFVVVGPTSGGGSLTGDWDWQWDGEPLGPPLLPTPVVPTPPGTAPTPDTVPWVPTIPVPPLGAGDQLKIAAKKPDGPTNNYIFINPAKPDETKSGEPAGKDSVGKYAPTTPHDKELKLIMPGCITVATDGAPSGWQRVTVKASGMGIEQLVVGIPSFANGVTNKNVTIEMARLNADQTTTSIPVGTGTGMGVHLAADEEVTFLVRATAGSGWSIGTDGGAGTRLDYQLLANGGTWDDGTAGPTKVGHMCVIVNPQVPAMSVGAAPSFQYPVGYASTSKTFTIENSGAAGSILNFTLTPLEDDAGITLSPTTGSLGQDEQVTITATLAAGKGAGTYVSSFTASAPGVADQNIDVDLEVVPSYVGQLHFHVTGTDGFGNPITPIDDPNVNYIPDATRSPLWTLSSYPSTFRLGRNIATGAWFGIWEYAESSSSSSAVTFRSSDGAPSFSGGTWHHISDPATTMTLTVTPSA